MKKLHLITDRNAHVLLDPDKRLIDTEHTYCSQTHIDSIFYARILYWVTLVRRIKVEQILFKSKTFILRFFLSEWLTNYAKELKPKLVMTSNRISKLY